MSPSHPALRTLTDVSSTPGGGLEERAWRSAWSPSPVGGVPAAKVGPPALPTGFVPRDHLSALVEAAAATAPVTTLRAHAGAGKTLLLADWARTSPVATAWVSLDPTDDRPGRLPAAVAHAVAACVPDLAGALVGPPSGSAPTSR